MTATVELVHNKIIDKIQELKNLIVSVDRLFKLLEKDLFTHINDNCDFKKIKSISNFNLWLEDLCEIEDSYNLIIINTLTNYYSFKGKLEEPKYIKEFFHLICSENISSKIDDVVLQVKKILSLLKNLIEVLYLNQSLVDKIYSILRKHAFIEAIDINTKSKQKEYELCKCGDKMTVLPSDSQLICESCGSIKKLLGTVFEDYQFYNQDGQKTKHGSYDPNRHYRFWMERIQAKENKIFPRNDLDLLEKCFERDGVKSYNINCKLMRDYLKECKLTQHNDHVPLLVKIFSGKFPPQLTLNEHRNISIKFNLIMEIYEKMRAPEDNRLYYPYFIYKICEEEFVATSEKLEILDFIHLQSDDTLKKNDLIYQKICSESNGVLVYKPTIPRDF